MYPLQWIRYAHVSFKSREKIHFFEYFLNDGGGLRVAMVWRLQMDQIDQMDQMDNVGAPLYTPGEDFAAM